MSEDLLLFIDSMQGRNTLPYTALWYSCLGNYRGGPLVDANGIHSRLCKPTQVQTWVGERLPFRALVSLRQSDWRIHRQKGCGLLLCEVLLPLRLGEQFLQFVNFLQVAGHVLADLCLCLDFEFFRPPEGQHFRALPREQRQQLRRHRDQSERERVELREHRCRFQLGVAP